MKKIEAIKLFKNQHHFAMVLGKTSSAISQWPDQLTDNQINLVIGAAVRNGIAVPKQFRKKSCKTMK